MEVGIVPEIVVIFVEPETSGNIGAIARLLKNFNISKYCLVKPRTKIDSDAYRHARHAADVLDNIRIYESLQEAIQPVDFVVGTTGIRVAASTSPRLSLTPAELVEKISDVDGEIGIVLGREDVGLSNEELSMCDVAVTIPASEEYPVLNVAHTAAILFYEVFNKLNKKEPVKTRPASGREKEELIKKFEEMLKLVEYPVFKRKKTILMFRRIMGRAFISSRETYSLLGFFSYIHKKLRK